MTTDGEISDNYYYYFLYHTSFKKGNPIIFMKKESSLEDFFSLIEVVDSIWEVCAWFDGSIDTSGNVSDRSSVIDEFIHIISTPPISSAGPGIVFSNVCNATSDDVGVIHFDG